MTKGRKQASCEHPFNLNYARGLCRLCYDRERRAKINWPEKMRRYNLTKYGITPEIYSSMLEEQNHKCKICGSNDMSENKGNKLHVDHCHETGLVRGLLCAKCNTGLGAFKDDRNLLYEAILYLKYYDDIKRD